MVKSNCKRNVNIGLLSALICGCSILAFPSNADMLIDRGRDIPRTPRNDTEIAYYSADIEMKLGTAYGSLDEPVILLKIKNTSSSAICLPQFSIPSLVGMENDIMTIIDVSSGELIPYKGLEGRTDYALDRVRILPPGQSNRFVYGLYQRYDLTRGHRYKIDYDVEAFYCNAFERGYPYADLLYKSEAQKASDFPFFERSPRTTVKLKSELTFTLE